MRTASRHVVLLAVAGLLMLGTLVLGCCDETATRPAAAVTQQQVDATVLAADDCVDSPSAAGAIPSPSSATAHLPSHVGDPAPIVEAARSVSRHVGAAPGRYQLCVMRT